MVLGRLDQNSGFHLQQKDSIDLQLGVNIVCLLTCLILVKACSYFQVSRTYISMGLFQFWVRSASSNTPVQSY